MDKVNAIYILDLLACVLTFSKFIFEMAEKEVLPLIIYSSYMYNVHSEKKKFTIYFWAKLLIYLEVDTLQEL